MARRLLTYLLIDTSGSMRGEPIEAVNVGIKMLFASLKKNPYALETIHLSVITFDSEIKEVLPLTHLEQLTSIPEIQCPQSGATLLGEGLKTLVQAVNSNIRRGNSEQKGDWAPIAIILTDGKPTDLQEFAEAIPLIRSCKFGSVIGCAAGPKSDPAYLSKFCTTTVRLDTMDGQKFMAFFDWISSGIGSNSQKVGGERKTDDHLPPPPPEINIVI